MYNNNDNKISIFKEDIPGSSFEQTMMEGSPQCYMPSFVEIGPPVPEKKSFKGFLPYMGVAAILVM